MCTAIHYKNGGSYFGRTLDLEYHYREEVVVTPRHFSLAFRNGITWEDHYAIIGMATVAENYPLYYEAANEYGLAIAGLNFPVSARYFPENPRKDNITPFELTPWLLGQCRDLTDAVALLKNLNLWGIPFSPEFPNSPLHWMIADAEGAVTVESREEGLKIQENPVGVLTNEPPFPKQLQNLKNYRHLTPNRKGKGALGLPGDLTSESRFIRAAFTKANSVAGVREEENVSQFFHILGTVAQTRGCNRMPDGRQEITRYTSCIQLRQGIYYYTTYENPAISAVFLRHCDLDSHKLHCFSLAEKLEISEQN